MSDLLVDVASAGSGLEAFDLLKNYFQYVSEPSDKLREMGSSGIFYSDKTVSKMSESDKRDFNSAVKKYFTGSSIGGASMSEMTHASKSNREGYDKRTGDAWDRSMDAKEAIKKILNRYDGGRLDKENYDKKLKELTSNANNLAGFAKFFADTHKRSIQSTRSNKDKTRYLGLQKDADIAKMELDNHIKSNSYTE